LPKRHNGRIIIALIVAAPGPSLLVREEAGLRGLWHTPSSENARLIPPLAGPEHFRNAFSIGLFCIIAFIILSKTQSKATHEKSQSA